MKRALEMFCIPYSFFFLVGFSVVLVGQKIESQTITKYIKTYHFMLSSQELSLILPLVPNWVNSRFGPILSKVDKIFITIWTYLELGNIHNYWHDYCCLNNADPGFDFQMRLMKIQNSNKILDHSVALYLIIYFHYPK